MSEQTAGHTIVEVDPDDRDQIQRIYDTVFNDRRGISPHTLAEAIRNAGPPPEPPYDGPIVHSVMYRNGVLGTICNSGAWGNPELFTAVIEHVTCPGCKDKLHGTRGE